MFEAKNKVSFDKAVELLTPYLKSHEFSIVATLDTIAIADLNTMKTDNSFYIEADENKTITISFPPTEDDTEDDTIEDSDIIEIKCVPHAGFFSAIIVHSDACDEDGENINFVLGSDTSMGSAGNADMCIRHCLQKMMSDAMYIDEYLNETENDYKAFKNAQFSEPKQYEKCASLMQQIW